MTSAAVLAQLHSDLGAKHAWKELKVFINMHFIDICIHQIMHDSIHFVHEGQMEELFDFGTNFSVMWHGIYSCVGQVTN